MTLILLLGLACCSWAMNQGAMADDAAMDSARTKVWWFHGKYPATKEGMTADLEAFKEVGIGGVVFYDQVHGEPEEGVAEAMSNEWWEDIKFAASEAKRIGLTFECHVSNGFVAGGPWITPEYAMKTINVTDTLINIKKDTSYAPQKDIALMAIPVYEESSGDHQTYRHLSYIVRPQGKATTSATNVPVYNDSILEHFVGTGYHVLPPLGELQASDDSITWRKVTDIKPLYKAHESYRRKTVSFPATTARYFRIILNDSLQERYAPTDIKMGKEAKINEVEYKAAYISDYIEPTMATPDYSPDECVKKEDIINLTDGGTLKAGTYRLLCFTMLPKGSKIKHGRKGMSGYECDKMSTEAAKLQFDNYFGQISDSLAVEGLAIDGMVMDSHEAGAQNWTNDFPDAFKALRGYDLTTYLPVVAGYVVDNVETSERVLFDMRKTIAQLISKRYYGTLDSLCRARGVTFTAQATGNAQCINAIPIEAKGRVAKPQGEVWMMHPNGNYDIKEASSAAHIYGKRIASAEAFTDGDLTTTPDSMRAVADIAYAFGINEFVICASAHQPDTVLRDGGRCYDTYTRNNPMWMTLRPFFDYQARVSALLRQGRPVADICVYLGGDAPARILAHRLPIIPSGYDFDAFTDEVLHRMEVVDGRISVGEGDAFALPYRLMVVPPSSYIDDMASKKLASLAASGAEIYYGMFPAEVLDSLGIEPDIENTRLFCHRMTDDSDIYFIRNHDYHDMDGEYTFKTTRKNAFFYDAMTDETTPLEVTDDNGYGRVRISIPRRSSAIVMFYE